MPQYITKTMTRKCKNLRWVTSLKLAPGIVIIADHSSKWRLSYPHHPLCYPSLPGRYPWSALSFFISFLGRTSNSGAANNYALLYMELFVSWVFCGGVEFQFSSLKSNSLVVLFLFLLKWKGWLYVVSLCVKKKKKKKREEKKKYWIPYMLSKYEEVMVLLGTNVFWVQYQC